MTYARQMRRYGLGQQCVDAEWDGGGERYSKAMAGWRMKNEALVTVLKAAGDIVDRMMRTGVEFSHDAFRDLFRPKREQVDVVAYTLAVAKDLEAVDQVGNARVYHGLAVRMAGIVGPRGLPFDELTPKWLKTFEKRLREAGCGAGGLSAYMRTMRAVANRAIVDGLMKPDQYPFKNVLNHRGYDVGQHKSNYRPRPLANVGLEKLKAFGATGRARVDDNVRFFLLMYFARGMNFADIAHLRWKDIYDGRIHYTRRKTVRNGSGANFSLAITPEIQAILDHYPKGSNAYVLPILNQTRHRTAKQQANRVAKCRRTFNTVLSEVGAELGLDMRITSYVARHTFGAVLRRKGVSMRDIGDAYGHTNSSTTEHYVGKLVGEELDHLNKLL